MFGNQCSVVEPLKGIKTQQHLYTDTFSGESRPLDKGGRGHGHSDPEIRGGGGSQKHFFWPFGLQFGLKIMGGGGGAGPPGPSRGSATKYSSSCAAWLSSS